MQDVQLARWKRLRGVDIHAELEKILGSETRFRTPYQEEVMRLATAKQRLLVVILLVGGGKSFDFHSAGYAVWIWGDDCLIVPLYYGVC
jgi:superfamily II DNA helicase RecQ